MNRLMSIMQHLEPSLIDADYHSRASSVVRRHDHDDSLISPSVIRGLRLGVERRIAREGRFGLIFFDV